MAHILTIYPILCTLEAPWNLPKRPKGPDQGLILATFVAN